ncbi:universal stress protein [Mycobacterium cookii]|uniref:Universal stress protein n=1 Tax=Mycobacterium cookii TaxID=1775 RepID=A0A7I7KSH2_9MYCO|nr:universal stress protein [Mycobacterium cookii]MCV7330919.1 universal stress protein [Mycobacterium cookii]BBX45050.1 universal stress protein [Mycobacterium cookii]
MNNALPPRPVVVAVDGSDAAIGAAEWAAKEAVHHAVALRLVHVIHESADLDGPERQYSESALHAACSAVKATGLPVEVDTEVLHGDVGAALIGESESATLVCVGSAGIGRVAAAVLGSTAATLAERARCPVAIIRRSHGRPLPEAGFIVVILDGDPGDENAMRWGMEEARVRRAPVLALGVWSWPHFDIDNERVYRRLNHWLHRYPDVKVEVATTRLSAQRYLQTFIGAIQLVVIGHGGADRVLQLVGPHKVPIRAHADCSVLVAHGAEQTDDNERGCPPAPERSVL